ncbi:lipocalin family protein [Sphingobacterium athyrii]|uniref:Lipocalin-like domain-containing protein n=1 Tax=Sphingobacterium athyrii TaxID=2152717 RepID=A0A363NPY0_9SPHI|nr:lipocalin family protein [Sphingobacterium athyrii]PUV22855.1 hypothetical protein DCO56_18195 [Sphingobacterium athyrii]
MKTLHVKHKPHSLWLTMCFFILLFTGCSKDNDFIDENDAKKTAESIVGKWNLEKLVNQEIPGTTDTYTGKNGEWAEFKKDGTGSQRWDEGDGSFDLEPFTWKVRADKLIFKENGDDDEEAFTIIKLTTQELVFKGEGTYKNGDGKDIKWIETYYLKK